MLDYNLWVRPSLKKKKKKKAIAGVATTTASLVCLLFLDEEKKEGLGFVRADRLPPVPYCYKLTALCDLAAACPVLL